MKCIYLFDYTSIPCTPVQSSRCSPESSPYRHHRDRLYRIVDFTVYLIAPHSGGPYQGTCDVCATESMSNRAQYAVLVVVVVEQLQERAPNGQTEDKRQRLRVRRKDRRTNERTVVEGMKAGCPRYPVKCLLNDNDTV